MSFDISSDKKCGVKDWGCGAVSTIVGGGAVISALTAGFVPFDISALFSRKDTISKVCAICCGNITIPPPPDFPPTSASCLEALSTYYNRDLATTEQYFGSGENRFGVCIASLPADIKRVDLAIAKSVEQGKGAVIATGAFLAVGLCMLGGYGFYKCWQQRKYTPISSMPLESPRMVGPL